MKTRNAKDSAAAAHPPISTLPFAVRDDGDRRRAGAPGESR